MRLFAIAVLLASVMAAAPALADAVIPTKDVAKAKDNPQVQRYEGAFILDYDFRAFTDIAFPLSRLEKTGNTGPANNNEYAPKQKAELEGARTRLVYLIPEGRSPLEVVRNYQQAIEAKGGKTLYQCKDTDCGGNARYGVDTGGGDMSLIMFSYPPGEFKAPSFSNASCALTTWLSDQRYAVMKFGQAGAETYVSVQAYVLDEKPACKAFNARTVAICECAGAEAARTEDGDGVLERIVEGHQRGRAHRRLRHHSSISTRRTSSRNRRTSSTRSPGC